MTYIPPILMRPRPPGAQIQQEASPPKGGKGDKGKQAVPEPEPEETTEDGGKMSIIYILACRELLMLSL